MKNIYIIILCLLLPKLVIAQSPGGVTSGLKAWYKADAHTNQPAGSGWPDQSGNGKNLINGGTVPTWISGSSLYNFNPYFNFTAANGNYFYTQTGIMGTNASPGTIFSVVRSNSSTTAFKEVGGFGNDNPQINQDGILGYDLWRQNANRIDNFGGDVSSLPTHSINMFWNQSGGSQLQLNGFNSTVNSTVDGNITDNLFTVGSEGFNVPGVGSSMYIGGIPEVIVYNQNLNATDQSKINSYLAIKYGYTLRQSNITTGTFDYVNSGGTPVWDGAANSTYHNNVAGIARDNASGLHQKQSKSVNSGSQVLISTTGVAGTNQANTVGLNDGQFLVWGDNNLAKSLTTALVTTLPAGKINLRFAAIWKVQNTGTVGTVRVMWPAVITNLHLVQSTDTTFDTSDTFTSMSNIQIINGIPYAYADVSLATGSYFTFAGFQGSPGGISSGLKAWYKTDYYVAQPTVWEDVSGNAKNLTSGGVLPTWTNGNTIFFNFNPYFNFTAASGNYFYTQAGIMGTNTTPGSFFTVGKITNPPSFLTVVGFGDDDPNLAGSSGGSYGPRRDNVASSEINIGSNIGALPAHIPNYFWNASGGNQVQLNGSYSGVNNVGGDIIDNLFAIGSEAYNVPGVGSELYAGGIPEVIVYNQNLANTINAQKVNTYLAVKYGVTLSHDYLSSAAATTKIWDTSFNSGYNNNIAGIARDDASSLHQKQSMSVNSGSQVLISTTGVADTNPANTVGLNDGQFLVWGDNNLSKTLSTALVATLPAGKVNNHFAAIWKVQNTGTVGTVRVMWPVGITNLHLVQSTDATFDAASDTFTSMSATQTINGKTYAYADVTLADTSYFTFAGFQSAPGGVLSPEVWLRADTGTSTTTNNASVAEWDNYGTSGGTAGQLGTLALPTYTSNKHNFNPAITDNSTNLDGSMKLLNVYTALANRALESYILMSQPNPGNNNNSIITYTSNTAIGNDSEMPRFYFTSATNFAFWWSGPYTSNFSMGITRTAGTPYISGYSLTLPVSGKNNKTWLLNGKTQLENGTNATSVGQNLFIFADSNGNDSSGGDMSEIITYSKVLTTTEKARVNSYLAIKYGITYLNDAGTGTQDYLNTDGNKVWTNLVNYQNNVFGIGRDDASALHQRISSSVNSSTLTVSTDANFTNANSAHTNIDTDKQFLIFGDNNGAVAFSGTAITATDGTLFSASEVLARRWKVQDFGGVDCVNLRFNNALFTTLTGATKYYIIAADDAAFTQNVRYKEVSAVSNNIDIMINFGDNTSTTSSGGNYFTIAKKDLGIMKADLPPVIGINTITSISSWQLSSKNTYLEINSNSKGLIVSRVANTSAITLPITGMLIYDLSDNSFKVYTGTAWRKLSGSGDTTIFCN